MHTTPQMASEMKNNFGSGKKERNMGGQPRGDGMIRGEVSLSAGN
jgi:hypothetical protein